MKTANELKEECHYGNKYKNGVPEETYYHFTEEQFANLWSQLCKEQRKLCSIYAHKNDYIGIENAPEPELE